MGLKWLLTAICRSHHMQEVVDTQTNLSKLIDNQELSSWTFEDMMSFIGADEATFA